MKTVRKIIIIGPAFPYRGGIAAFTDRLAKEFFAESFDIEVFTFSLQYPSALFPGKTQYSDAKAPDNIVIHRTINSVNPFSWFKTVKMITKKNPDLVIFAYWLAFFSPCYGTMARKMKKMIHTTCIGLIHNMMPHEKSILDRILAPFFMRNMDGFVALSKSVLTDIEHFDKWHKPKAYALHPLYDHFGSKEDREVALKLLNLNADYRYMLFFGLVRSYKGLELLLDALSDERFDCLPVKLIVAGEFYDEKKPCLDKIDRLNLNQRVILFDQYIPDDQVKNYFNVADIVVQPYRSATQSGVTQIAYHFDKPMLVTDVGGLRETVPNGKVGYVVKPEAQEIASALVDFFQHSRLREFEANAQNEKQKYSWSKMVEILLSLNKN